MTGSVLPHRIVGPVMGLEVGQMAVFIRRILFVLLLAAFAAAQERARIVHVFVALCDNEQQGIVPVREKLGNGDDPAKNLYQGAVYLFSSQEQ